MCEPTMMNFLWKKRGEGSSGGGAELWGWCHSITGEMKLGGVVRGKEREPSHNYKKKLGNGGESKKNQIEKRDRCSGEV